MLRQGWALAYRQFYEDYDNEERTAKKSLAGLWAGKFARPWEWRRLNP
jgi:endonuclease YncB( thermonuclease family)